MPRIVAGIGFLALMFALIAGFPAPAAAGPTDKGQQLAAKSRPHITVYPRHRRLGPNAKRQCRAWLAQEYRVSGPVIVPRQQCWWE